MTEFVSTSCHIGFWRWGTEDRSLYYEKGKRKGLNILEMASVTKDRLTSASPARPTTAWRTLSTPWDMAGTLWEHRKPHRSANSLLYREIAVMSACKAKQSGPVFQFGCGNLAALPWTGEGWCRFAIEKSILHCFRANIPSLLWLCADLLYSESSI